MENKGKIKIIILIGVFFIFFATFFIIRNNDTVYEEAYFEDIYVENIDNTELINEVEKIKIHIIGEINSPGIYELVVGSRIQDAIIAAGGQTVNADLDKVNLAYELEDGQKIKIPSIFQEENVYIYNEPGNNVIIEDENSLGTSSKININKASIEDLQKINGVGPSLAEKIIRYREDNGKFKKIEDLKNVSGIGDKKYEVIKEHVTVK